MKGSRLMLAAVLALGMLGSNGYAGNGTTTKRGEVKKHEAQIFSGIRDVRPGEITYFELPTSDKRFVYSLQFQVEAVGSHDAGASVWVNGEKKGDLFSPGRVDPSVTITVAAETKWIRVDGYAFPNQNGTLRIKKVVAYYHPKPVTIPSRDGDQYRGRPNVERCGACRTLPFDTYNYRSRMGAIANRVIILVDRLDAYTDYASYGSYLLPIKKSAAMARARAETFGDASRSSRVYYENLLNCLDAAEEYLSNMYERNAAFDLATELLGMREHLRDTLD